MRLILTTQPISFGYKNVLKTEYLNNPEMREHVKYGIYGGLLNQDTVSLEHIKPHSKGGKSRLSNFALATKNNNNARSNRPIKFYLTKENFEQYISQFKGWTAKMFDNTKYVENITKAVMKEGVKL